MLSSLHYGTREERLEVCSVTLPVKGDGTPWAFGIAESDPGDDEDGADDDEDDEDFGTKKKSHGTGRRSIRQPRNNAHTPGSGSRANVKPLWNLLSVVHNKYLV